MSYQETFMSPRIATLIQELEAGSTSALETFWQEITAQGTPLIEPIQDNDTHSLVTFLWRAEEETRNVVIFSDLTGSLSGWRLAKSQMIHLPGTDLWYKTYRVRNDARSSYQLSPNDPLAESENVEDWNAHPAIFQIDPLNPQSFFVAKDEEDPTDTDFLASIVALPGAPAQTWSRSRSGIPMGNVEMHRLHSDILDNERRLWVYTPPGYTMSGEPYGLAVFFDGLTYIDDIPAPTIMDNLLAEERIPRLVVVCLGEISREIRSRELPCYQPFVDFLTKELVPWVRQRYHVTSDPRQTIVGGVSYGGLAAAFVGLRASETFGNVLSQSGSFWWKPGWEKQARETEYEWLTRQFVTSPTLPLRFYLEVGLMENMTGHRDECPSQMVVNRHMRDILQAKGYNVYYTEYNGGHDDICWRGTLANGLQALVGKR